MRQSLPSLRLLGALALATTALIGTAAAKPARPPTPNTGALVLPPGPPPPVDSITGSPTLTAHVQGRADQLGKCMSQNRATFVRARATLRWDARGRVLGVSTYGGSAAFNRCAARALRTLVAGVAARGSGTVSMIVRRTTNPVPDPIRPGPMPTPIRPTPPPPLPQPGPPPGKPRAPSKAIDLQACTTSDECVLHFQTASCFAGDPVAVNKLDPAAVQQKFPVTHHACGIGGADYQRRREQEADRYSAVCKASRCQVVEHPVDRSRNPRDPVAPGR